MFLGNRILASADFRTTLSDSLPSLAADLSLAAGFRTTSSPTVDSVVPTLDPVDDLGDLELGHLHSAR